MKRVIVSAPIVKTIDYDYPPGLFEKSGRFEPSVTKTKS